MRRKMPAPPVYGGLPSMSQARQVTSESGPEVARSVGGGVAVAPAFGPAAAFGPFSSQTRKHLASAQAGGAKSAVPTAAGKSGALWDIQDKDVHTLPEFHPLETTAVFVPNSFAPDVAGRVSDVLRTRSIAATFDNSKAKVSCISEDGVDFRIRLYRGKGKFSHGIIVEVQRRFGFSMSFHVDTVAILDAAEGKVGAAPVPVAIPPAYVPTSQEAAPPLPQTSLSSLKIASEMLSKTGCVDSVANGLNVLVTVTNPKKVGKSASGRACREILSGGEGSLWSSVASFLLGNNAAPVVGNNDTLRDLKTKAINIVANVSQVMEGTDDLQTAQSAVATSVVPALIGAVRNATADARTADLACRALLPLIKTYRSDPSFIQGVLIEGGVREDLVGAHAVGERSHSSLEKSTKSCLKELD